MIQKNLGCILAGGKSLRMGRDKALMMYRKKNLLTIALELLENVGLEAAISCRKDQYSEFNHVKIYDQNEDLGPVGGIVSALLSHKIENFTGVVFLPVDMPLLTSELIAKLIVCEEGIDAVYFKDRPLPLFLRLSDKLTSVTNKIAEEKKSVSVKNFLSHLNAYNPKLEESDLKNLINVNDQKEWSLL